MSIRLAISTAAAGVFALGLAVAIPGEALAQANILKECGSQYQAAKAANQLNGQSWQEYLKACRARISEPAAAPAAHSGPRAGPGSRADDGGSRARSGPRADDGARRSHEARRHSHEAGHRGETSLRGASRDARARKAVRRGMEGPEGRTPQNQSGDEVAAVLERV